MEILCLSMLNVSIIYMMFREEKAEELMPIRN